jgi:hypothetical protein
MLANVRQTTIRPVIEASVAKGALVHTDEYDVYARLQDWGYGHKPVFPGWARSTPEKICSSDDPRSTRGHVRRPISAGKSC